MNFIDMINIQDCNGIYFEEISTGIKANSISDIEKLSMEWMQAFPDMTVEILNETLINKFSCHELLWRGTHLGSLNVADGCIPSTGRSVAFRSVLITDTSVEKDIYIRHYFDIITIFDQLA
ncbi:hypothetical protein ACU8XX_22215 [Escherichia sp. MAL-1]